jgi:hypothetical protein
MKRLWITACAVLWTGLATAQSCPVDPSIVYTDREVLALRLFAIRPTLFDLNKLNQLPQTQITSERRNQVSGATTATDSQGTVWSGVLLRDFLLKNGLETVPSRALRNTRIEVVATDGYRASFSWGEVFNSPAGSQILIITKQDGKALDLQEGPVSFRALSDIRPGVRHVRNVCAISVVH